MTRRQPPWLLLSGAGAGVLELELEEESAAAGEGAGAGDCAASGAGRVLAGAVESPPSIDGPRGPDESLTAWRRREPFEESPLLSVAWEELLLTMTGSGCERAFSYGPLATPEMLTRR